MKRSLTMQGAGKSKKSKKSSASSVVLGALKKFKSMNPGRPHETKTVDITQNTDLYSTTAVFNLLNGMTAGANIQNRLGREVYLKSCVLHWVIKQTAFGTAPAADILRWMLVYDRQTNSATPVIADILTDVDQAGTASTNVLSFPSRSSKRRFKILRDVIRKVDAPGGVTAVQASQVATDFQSFSGKEYIRLDGLSENFNTGVSGTVTDITDGALWLIVFGHNTAADSQYSLEWSARVNFHDT